MYIIYIDDTGTPRLRCPRPTAFGSYVAISHKCITNFLFHPNMQTSNKFQTGTNSLAEWTNTILLYVDDDFVYICGLYVMQWIVLHSLSFVCVVFFGTFGTLHNGCQV